MLDRHATAHDWAISIGLAMRRAEPVLESVHFAFQTLLAIASACPIQVHIDVCGFLRDSRGLTVKNDLALEVHGSDRARVLHRG